MAYISTDKPPRWPPDLKARAVRAYHEIVAEAAPARTNGEITELARAYGVGRRTLYRWVAESESLNAKKVTP